MNDKMSGLAAVAAAPAVRLAVNDDAGALHGASGIPQRWKDKAALREKIEACAEQLMLA
jgi:hypothetical protein